MAQTGKYTELISKRFTRLTVLSVFARKYRYYAVCKCDCGTEKNIRVDSLLNGATRSCRCLDRETKTKHGHNKRYTGVRTRTYIIWSGMRSRCRKPENKDFKNYGGRGISVCDRWQIFANFLEDMGEAPVGLTIERINNDGNYEPENCKWATVLEQSKNKRWGEEQKRKISESLKRYYTEKRGKGLS